MTLESYVMPNGDEEAVVPEYEGKSTQQLWDTYSGFHEIDAKKEINRPAQREKRVRRHRKPLTQIIEETLGTDNEGNANENLDHVKSETAKKKKAAAIITKIAHAHYKTDDPSVKKPDEDRIRQFLQISGANVTYESLLKHIMDLPDLRYDTLQEDDPLRRIIDYTSSYKVPEGRKIELLRQYLSNPEHREGLANLLGDTVDKKIKPSATPAEMFLEHRAYVTEKLRDYQLKRETTSSAPKKKAA